MPVSLAVETVLAAILGLAEEPPGSGLDVPLVLDVGLVVLVNRLDDRRRRAIG